MIPGLIGMVLLFNGALSALNITYDKSSGVNNLLTIAPLSRSTILLSRIMSATIISLVHLLIFLIVLSVFGFIHTVKFIPMIFPVALIAASIGILIATFSRDFINFSIIINYIMLPMFFLSGALYPLQNLPWYLHTLVLVNPFSYAVDLIQHGFQLDAVVRFSLLADVGVLAGFFILFVLISCWRYNRAD